MQRDLDTHDLTNSASGAGEPTPAELGWVSDPPSRPEGDPPDGPDYEWVLTERLWKNAERPGEPSEHWYMWGWQKKPTPADIARVELLGQLAKRRASLDAVRKLPSVTSIKVPGLPIAVASSNDLDTIRRQLTVTAEILLDIMEVTAAGVSKNDQPVT